MGVNIYAVKHMSGDNMRSIIDLVRDGKYDDAKNTLSTLEHRYHIGKKSIGWRFVWALNPSLYSMTTKSISDFLSSDEYDLFDEYGKLVDKSNFVKDYSVYDEATDNYNVVTEEGLCYSDYDTDWC